MTIYDSIQDHLDRHGATFGGVLERVIGQEHNCKGSNVSRRARELEQDGIIKAEYVQVNGKGNKVVVYSLVKDRQLVLLQ